MARGYTKAVERARRLIYVEDQYLWGDHVGNVFTEALRRHPRPARRRRRADAPGRDGLRPDRPAPGAPRAMLDMTRRRPTGSRSTASRTRGHADLRPRQDLHRRRHLDDHRLRQLQPPLVDPRLRAVRGRGRHRRRLARDAAAHAGRRAPRPRRAEDVGTASSRPACSRRTPSAPPPSTTGTPGRVGPRPPGRLRRLEPPELGPVTRALALAPYLFLHDPDGRPRPLRAQRPVLSPTASGAPSGTDRI